MARHGARHIVIMLRSGYKDESSQRILKDLSSKGYQVDLTIRDVSNINNIKRAFQNATALIGSIIQGAIVLRVSKSWIIHIYI